MNKAQIRVISASTALGAVIGLFVGLVVSETKKEQLKLVAEKGDQVSLSPSITEWIGLTVAAVTLLRQIANILTPKLE